MLFLRPLTAAFPPALSTASPHLAARGCVHATMPLVLWTTLRRLGHFMNSPDGGGYTEEVGRGMAARGEQLNDLVLLLLMTSVRWDLGALTIWQETWWRLYKYLNLDIFSPSHSHLHSHRQWMD